MTTPRARTAKVIVRVVDGHRICFDEATSRRMGDVRQRDTTPELLVRRALAAHGLHFRTHNRDLPGSPDIANRARRWAVFVHGCYWHRHLGCTRTTTPKRNTDFWLAKFAANAARDARSRRALVASGYRVLTVWECVAEDHTRLDTQVARFAARLRDQTPASTRSFSASPASRARSSFGSQSRSS